MGLYFYDNLCKRLKKRGKGKITKAPPLSNLPLVVDIDSLGYCTLAHNRIAPLLL
jgi:hypothetical protein